MAYEILTEIAQEAGLSFKPAQPKKRPYRPEDGFSKAAMARRSISSMPTPQQRPFPQGWTFNPPPVPVPKQVTKQLIDWDDI